MPIPEGIVFDFDGLLADNTKAHTAARFMAFAKATIHTGDEKYGMVPFGTHVDAYTYGESSVAIIEHVLRASGIEIDESVVDQIQKTKKKEYWQLTKEGLLPIRGALDFVHWAHDTFGNNLALNTRAGMEHEVQPFLDRHNLNDIFPHIVTDDDVPEGRGKPDPYSFLMIAERMKIRPGRLLGFDDSPLGCMGARRAGLYVIAMTTTRSRQMLEAADPGPHLTLDDFDEAKIAVEQLLREDSNELTMAG